MSLFKIAVVGACLLCFAPFAAKAESTEPYPTRMIRYVVPFPPGATSDSVGRIIAQRLSEVLGQTVVVDNKPGAGTALAAEMVARAEPDGYTLFNVTNATLAAIPHLMKLGYDAETAFAPVALTGDLYSYLAVNPDLPVADFAQFVAHAKANPGKLNFGSAGNGSLGHLYGELLKLKAGIDIVHVPYRGSAAAILDAVARRLQVILDPATLPYIQAGKLRGLATLNEQRLPALPDLPTIAEAGVRGWNARLWFGVVVPAKTPPQIVAFLNRTINAILAEPKTMAQLRDLNIEPRRFTPDEIQKMVREESAFFSDLIKTAKIRVE